MKDGNSRKWMIALTCCFINFIQLGVGRMSGLLYLSAITRYNVNRNQASLPFFLCHTVRNVSGPFIGYMGKRIELKYVITFGCFLASVGAGACFLAENIAAVTVLWGVVFGLGLGMATILIPQVINLNFDQYISIANGIALGGECVAGFVLPIFIKLFENMYGTSGLFLILAAFMLHSIPAAMLLRSPSRSRRGTIMVSKSGNGTSEVAKASESSLTDKAHQSSCDTDSSLKTNQNGARITETTTTKEGSKNSIQLDACVLQRYSKLPSYQDEGLFNNSMQENTSNPILRKLSKSLEHTPGYETFRNDSDRIPVAKPKPPTDRKSCLGSFKLFIDPTFLVILITQSSVIYIGTMIITIVVDFCNDAGLSDNEQVYVLMAFSTADLIGRFGLGWISDGGYMASNTFFAFCHVLTGVFFVTVVYFQNFGMITATMFVTGMCFGGILIVSPAIVSDFMERDTVPMALASRYVLYAPMSLTQSPLIGYFRGKFGSYNWIMILMAVVCGSSAILSFVIPLLAKCRRKKEKEQMAGVALHF